MKKISVYLSFIMLSLVWACGEDDNMDAVGNWEMTNPAIVAPTATALVLDENEPDAATRFEWTAATTSNKFLIQYSVALVPAGSTDYAHALLTVTPANAGKNTWATVTSAEIDYALWAACYAPGAEVNLQWAVIAKAIDKTTVDTRSITVKRFDTEYVPTTLFLTGAATEAGTDVTKAIAFRALVDADKKQTGVFEVYTHLTKGATYFFRDQASTLSRKMGGADGKLTCGSEITAPETGEYRVTVDVINNTYTLLNIERWSLVGDAVEGGWDGDVPLAYVGNGVWEKEVTFVKPSETASFVVRANGNWSYLLKRITKSGTADNKGGKLIMESEGNATGVAYENIPGTTGLHKVTVSLTAAGYTYTLTKIAVVVETIIGKAKDVEANVVSGTFPIVATETPSTLFLLEDGQSIMEFTKDGSTFTSSKYLALQAGKTYSLNSAEDGSGVTFDGDDDGEITVDHDQAYTISVDFAKKEVSWKHYNLKVFHWDEANNGWEQRKEVLMTYKHPFTFEVTTELTGGYDTKINSPWEVQFGTSSTALTGTMNNVDPGPNFKGIASTGTYDVTLVIADDYKTGEYSFEK